MILPQDISARARRLSPLEHLSPQACDDLLARSSMLMEFRPGDFIYTQGQQDDFVSYLLQGRVQRIIDGVTLDTLDGDREERNRPLDQSPRKRETARALSPVKILRLHRSELERLHRPASDDAGTGSLEVMDIAADASNDWWTRLLSSDIFLRLSASTIHAVFDRLEEVSAQAGDEIVRQGDAGDFYYVIQSGACQVMRRTGTNSGEIQLAELGPGDAFGEEALIAGVPRNATVRMKTAGMLMRLGKADFMDLVVNPLVSGVSLRQGRWLVERGGGWIDVRDAPGGTAADLEDAVRVPVYMLRAHASRLEKEHSYVVFGETVPKSMLGAFLLAARGIDSAYLDAPLPALALEETSVRRTPTNGSHAPEGNSMSDEQKDHDSVIARASVNGGEPASVPASQEQRVARDEFGDTTTGVELADLIDEIYRQREELVEVVAPQHTAPAISPVERPAPAPAALPPRPRHDSPTGVSASEIVGEILQDVQSNISGYLAEFIQTQRGTLEQRVEQRLGALERAAREQIETREKALQAKFEQAFAEKEQGLADAYDRLTSLANRISQQKADIQKARTALESMLRTASRVHREVYRVGNALVSQIDHLDDLADDFKIH